MNGKTVLTVLSTATVLCVGSASGASKVKVHFGDESADQTMNATSSVSHSDDIQSCDVVKVKARGVGANKDEALKDAYRDAVERAIGLYVDAEQMVKNDEVVQDQVLTHSNAYITHYEEVDTKPLSGGLVQVRIVADVKKGQLTKKLEGVMPPQTVKVNGGILSDAYAQLVSKEKRADDSAALLKAALKDCDPVKSLIVADVRADSQKLLLGNQAEINGNPLPANKVMLRYLFELKLDREKYFASSAISSTRRA